MERRHCVYGTRAAGTSIMVCLALLCVPATALGAASGNSRGESASPTSDVLARGAGYGQRGGEASVRALQRRLLALGHRPGPVDGRYGPLTESAVESIQRESGLSADGIVGPQTRRVLNAETPPLVPGAGYGQPGGSPRVRAIQRSLRSAGHRPGPVDGVYGPQTQDAVARFQRTAGQAASGVLSVATAQALADTGGNQTASRADNGGAGAQKPEQREGSPASGAETPAGNGQAQKQPSNPAAGSDQSRTSTSSAANDRVEPQDEEQSSRLMLVVLGLGLAAAGGLLVALLQRKRSKPEARAAKRRPVLPRVSWKALKPARLKRSKPEPSAAKRRPVLPRVSWKALKPARLKRSKPEQSARKRRLVMPRPSWKALKPSRSDSAPQEARTVALGYVSVRNHSAEGKELQEQTTAIYRACRQRGLLLQKVIRDVGQTDAKVSKRPGLREVLRRLAGQEGTCLVVAGLERLDCTPAELSRIIEWVRRSEGRLVAVDERIDTGTQVGGEVADKLAALCAFNGQSAATPGGTKPQPTPRSNGTRARVSRHGPALESRMTEMRGSGMTLQEIADRLNAEKVPAPRGGVWEPSTVQAAIGGGRAGPEAAQPSQNGQGKRSGSGGKATRSSERPTSDRKEGAVR